MADPYRTMDPIPPRHPGPRPLCFCQTNDENKFAIAALGGWWHSPECLAWKRAMQLYQEQMAAYQGERRK